jgi:hypothetical protein
MVEQLGVVCPLLLVDKGIQLAMGEEHPKLGQHSQQAVVTLQRYVVFPVEFNVDGLHRLVL